VPLVAPENRARRGFALAAAEGEDLARKVTPSPRYTLGVEEAEVEEAEVRLTRVRSSADGSDSPDPRRSSYGPDYWLRRCDGFLVETPTAARPRLRGQVSVRDRTNQKYSKSARASSAACSFCSASKIWSRSSLSSGESCCRIRRAYSRSRQSWCLAPERIG
jgi:hypothetical protein